jgi:hypothetical protein
VGFLARKDKVNSFPPVLSLLMQILASPKTWQSSTKKRIAYEGISKDYDNLDNVDEFFQSSDEGNFILLMHPYAKLKL